MARIGKQTQRVVAKPEDGLREHVCHIERNADDKRPVQCGNDMAVIVVMMTMMMLMIMRMMMFVMKFVRHILRFYNNIPI